MPGERPPASACREAGPAGETGRPVKLSWGHQEAKLFIRWNFPELTGKPPCQILVCS